MVAPLLPLLLALGVAAGDDAVATTGGLALRDLRVEHLANPLGLDKSNPRFQWTIIAPAGSRAVTQASYRVAVTAEGTSTPVWDSGTVAGNATFNVRYNGSALQSATGYRWTVLANVNGGSTATASAAFSTGQLARTDWAAEFVGRPAVGSWPEGSAHWFRSEPFVAAAAGDHSALLSVASVGFCEVSVNGQPASDAVLSPSISYLPSRVLYRTYNITSLLRLTKSNVIGLWASPGWAEYFSFNNRTFNASLDDPPAPLVMAQLQVGGKVLTKTGPSSGWKVRRSTTTRNGDWGKGGFGGDSVDMRLDVPGWDTPELKMDNGWSAVQTYKVRPTSGGTDAGYSPHMVQEVAISADVMEATTKDKQYAAKRITASKGKRAGSTDYLVEMSELFTGWFEVKNLKGAPGSTVSFSVSTTGGIKEEFNMQDSFTFGSTGTGTFTMRFAYHEIQYITIGGLSAAPKLGDVVGWRLTSSFRKSGDFSCSDDMISKIYSTTVNNYQGITTGGQTVDCPHRERRGYGGDGHTSYQFALANFQVGAYFTKWARDFADTQMPDGDVPHTAPTVGGGGGPAWSGFVVTMPWQTYRTFGDVDILEAMYPTMQKQLAFYEDKTCHKVQTSPCFSKGQQTICRPNCTSADGLLKPWTLSYWDFLGDWITPHGNEGPFCTHNNPCKGWDGTNDNPDALLFNNAYMAYITRLAAKIATILGKDKDAQMYITQAAARAAAINKAFYVPGTGGYYDTLQTHIVMPLSCGVVPKAQEEKVMAALEQQFLANKSHIDVGLTGNYFLTRLLTGDTLDIGRPSEGYQRNDLMMALTNQTTAPGYGFFLSQGYTTWPESWDAPKNGYQHELSRCEAAAAAAQAGDEHAEHSSAISKMHGCYNAIGLWFVQGIAGITVDAAAPSEGGYALTVRAGIDAGTLTWAKGQRAALGSSGEVLSSWSLDSPSGFAHNVSIPVGSIAKVMIPVAGTISEVTESGKPIASAVDVVVLDGGKPTTVNKETFVSVEVGSGTYLFASKWQRR